MTVELLNVVTDGTEGAEVVEPDKVRTPLPALDVGKERCVSGHVNDVGITFYACEEGCFIERSLKMVTLLFLAIGIFALSMAGIFAREDLWSLTVVTIVAQTMRKEPLLVAIEVLVV